ncbi:MAG: T9SS type A sorting domain-containing protein [Flavobacterium sp.]
MKKYLLLSIAFVFSSIQAIQGQVLDPTFGTGGKITYDFGMQGDVIKSMVLQSDGKIIVAAKKEEVGYYYPYLVRFNQDGSVDTSFGNNGGVKISLLYGSNWAEPTFSLSLTSDKKIIVTGNFDTLKGIARLNQNGSTDTSFGVSGAVILPISTFSFLKAAHILSDDSVLVFGEMNKPNFERGFLLSKYSPLGILDVSFGVSGYFKYDFGTGFPGGSGDYLKSYAIQNDGKILMAGLSRRTVFYDWGQAAQNYWAITRANPNGTLDTSFADNGKLMPVPSVLWGTSNTGSIKTIFAHDNNIVVLGTCENHPIINQNIIFKFNIDGTPNTQFGNGTGQIQYSIANSENTTLMQPDGKILAAGYAPGVEANQFPVAYHIRRYNLDGTIDATFGTNGNVLDYFSPGNYYNYITAMALHNGKLIVGGTRYSPYGIAGLARYDLPILATEQAEAKEFTVYPNPVKDLINVSPKTKFSSGSTALLLDMNGRVVNTYPLHEDTTTLPVPNGLTSGIYILKITDGTTNSSHKLIIE